MEIEKKIPNTVLYIYTRDVKEAQSLILTTNIKSVHVMFVAQEQLYVQLQDKKFGFVIREDCVVNNVSTPTKLSNYLANGIIPIYTDAIKDFSRIMNEKEYHIRLKSEFDLSGWTNQICNSILMHEQDPDKILAEYTEIFNMYYLKQLHIVRAKEPIRDTFS